MKRSLSELFPFFARCLFSALRFVSRQKDTNAKAFLVRKRERKKYNGNNLGMTIDIAHTQTHTHTLKNRERKIFCTIK